MAKPKKFGRTGTWYFRWVYQMRDIDSTKLQARTEAEALGEGQMILKKYPDLDQPHIVFMSNDGSIKYTVNL